MKKKKNIRHEKQERFGMIKKKELFHEKEEKIWV